MLKFSILGALQVRTVSGPAEISGDLQRTLVQTLLVSEGQPVSGEGLVEEMWGEAVPDNQANALQAHVSRLRRKLKALEPGRPVSRVTIHLRIPAHRGGGRTGRGRVRTDRARSGIVLGVRRGRHRPDARTGPLAVARTGLRRVPRRHPLPVGRRRYEEYRMRAMELRFDAELRLGRHAAVLAELAEAHSNHPLRERFCEQLMVACTARDGRPTPSTCTAGCAASSTRNSASSPRPRCAAWRARYSVMIPLWSVMRVPPSSRSPEVVSLFARTEEDPR